MHQFPVNKIYSAICEIESIKEAIQFGKSALPLPSFRTRLI